MKAVEIKNLNYSYSDGTKALQNINLSIECHKKIAILGSNGSGKTTLLQHLNGLFLPQEGSINIFGKTITGDEIKYIRETIGLVFDNPDNQLFATSVFEDVAFGPRNLKLDEVTVKKRVLSALEEVGMLDYVNRPPYNLSLGQKKRVAIAGVLAMEPKLLILDEPFSGLDPVSSQQLQIILEKLNKNDCTIIISTHDVDFTYSWADEVIILQQGTLLTQGTVELLCDADLMEISLLNTPKFASIFLQTGIFPRTLEEANQIILKLLKGV